MTVKFRVGFTIDGEALFELIAKALPIEDLSVEELQPVASRLSTAPPSLSKPAKFKRRSPGPNLKRGINGIIVTELKEGPKRAVHLENKVIAAGFSRNSTTSRLEELRKHGVIERTDDGAWRLK